MAGETMFVQSEITKHILNDPMAQSLELVQKKLQNDVFYTEQRALLADFIVRNDLQKCLECLMTIHNMEMEEAYKAGHRDCIGYLVEIGKLTK